MVVVVVGVGVVVVVVVVVLRGEISKEEEQIPEAIISLRGRRRGCGRGSCASKMS